MGSINTDMSFADADLENLEKNVSHQLFKSICLGTQLMCYRGLVGENAIKFCVAEIGQYVAFFFVHKRVW